MTLIKQFIEIRGFDQIEAADRPGISKIRDDFIARYSSACNDPDDISLKTELSNSDQTFDSEKDNFI